MEQEGIYYFFEHEDDKHTLVMADSYSAHKAIEPAEIPYLYADENAVRERDHISEWFVSQEIQPGAYALNDFDFEKPRASASGSLKVKSLQKREHALAEYEIYDYPGEYTESGDGENYAKTWLESLQAQHEQTRGSGDARGLAVGGLFTLTEYPREDQNREYLITSANYIFGVRDLRIRRRQRNYFQLRLPNHPKQATLSRGANHAQADGPRPTNRHRRRQSRRRNLDRQIWPHQSAISLGSLRKGG